MLADCQHPTGKFIFNMVAIPLIVGIVLFLLWWAIDPNGLKNVIADNVITENVVNNFLPGKKNKTVEESGCQRSVETSEKRINLISIIRNDILIPLTASPLTPVVITLIFFLFVIHKAGRIYGKSVGNGVVLSPRQFPKVYKMADKMAKDIGLSETPEIILVNGNGKLNSFACTVPMIRNAIIIYSDIFERCLANNDLTTLKFILGHELGHIKYHHTKWWYYFLTFPLIVIPGINIVLGKALSRTSEYSCDKLGAILSGDETGKSLMILQAGKYNYQDVNFKEFSKLQDKKNILVTLSNFFMDYPITSWRIFAIAKKHHGGVWFRKK